MVGLGELLARLERRRQLLAAEGLFAPELKRPLPFLPGRVGLVTAPDSAAERDVLDNARRRWPAVAFEVAYAAMQGPRAAAEVIEALERLDRDAARRRDRGRPRRRLGRGPAAVLRRGPDPRGARSARTPVVSAIGHEPDQPLLDLVADVRASTPTDAAKLVVPDVAEELRSVDSARDRLRARASPAGSRASRPGSTRCAPGRRSPTPHPARRRAPTRSPTLRERARRTPAPPPRPGRRRHRPPPRPGPGALAAGDPAPRLRRPPGRRRPRGHLGRRRRHGRRRQRSASPTAGCTPRPPTRKLEEYRCLRTRRSPTSKPAKS